MERELVTYVSDKYVWCQCELVHEWKATVGNRATKGHECPYCTGKKAWPGFNDLATLEPQLMKEWHPMFNLGISPRKLRPGSGKKVWWKCPEGHEWEAVIANRTKRRSGCPFCAGNMAKGKAIEWTAYAMRKEAELRQVGLFGQREDAGKNEILKKEREPAAGNELRVV